MSHDTFTHRELDHLTRAIIAAGITVSNSLGHGFLEVVYKRALALEIEAAGLSVAVERPFEVVYRQSRVGLYVADLVVENQVLVELKAVEMLAGGHIAQVMNYLRVSGLPLGLLLNFGQPRMQVRRIGNPGRVG